MKTATTLVDLSQLTDGALRVLETYRRTRGIYERTSAAMGRTARYQVRMASTTTVRIGDVLIHSPGGSPEATERIVALLRSRFRADVQFLVPHSAYSAATMLVLSGNQIILHPSATLGPIDPQVNGLPARSIRRGFDKIRELLRSEGPEALPAYLPLIEKHSIEILEICDDSLKLSKEL